MADKSYKLWPDDSPHHHTSSGDDDPNVNPRMDIYFPDNQPPKPMSAVIVLPGGGYSRRAGHEGEPVAKLFTQIGIVGVVCHYRVAPYRHPLPYADAARAVRKLRDKSDELNINPSRIALMGFSAGGHLAATVGVQPRLHRDGEDDLIENYSARPDRLILAYPVISFLDDAHTGSRDKLIGEHADDAEKLRLSNERHVNKSTPPTFLFHTADDPAVSVSNSLRYATACDEHDVPFEMHIYESGRHGVGLAEDDPKLSGWPDLLLNWMSEWGG